ncbi:MAG TPA: PAS domain-containing protein, partial [Anaerolineae bacterium]|nr:PAS domain-containing protein [Anaerolineae bacterium]
MQDQHKTKAELLSELAELRQEVARLRVIEADCMEQKQPQQTGEISQQEVSQKRLLAIIETTSDFVAIADADGRARYINRAGRAMVGLGEFENITSTRIPDYYPPHVAQIIMNEALPVAVRDGVWSGETTFLHRDGREISVSEVIIAHKSSQGEVEFFSTIVRD